MHRPEGSPGWALSRGRTLRGGPGGVHDWGHPGAAPGTHPSALQDDSTEHDAASAPANLSEMHLFRTSPCARIGTGRRLPRRAAYTLVELMSVMAIIGVLSSLAVPRFSDAIERARVAKAIGDLRTITIELLSADSLPESLAGIGRATLLDPWGRPYQYLKFPGASGNGNGNGNGPPPQGARKDRFLVPINSMFDVYSLGKDGESAAPLTAARSRDDVIVANDGGFTGLARNF